MLDVKNYLFYSFVLPKIKLLIQKSFKYYNLYLISNQGCDCRSTAADREVK